MLPDLAAVTGGTGFLGSHVVDALLRAGWRVRVLARGEAVFPAGVEVVRGDLADAGALGALVRGAGAVVHAAGLVKARSRAEFMAVNRDGAARLAGAVGAGARVVLVSSQAARCPLVSAYAAS
ncbi:MAG: NAD-dependent epimerase/dehydratase family protein, partial [Janthinobacterium lividum]